MNKTIVCLSIVCILLALIVHAEEQIDYSSDDLSGLSASQILIVDMGKLTATQLLSLTSNPNFHAIPGNKFTAEQLGIAAVAQKLTPTQVQQIQATAENKGKLLALVRADPKSMAKMNAQQIALLLLEEEINQDHLKHVNPLELTKLVALLGEKDQLAKLGGLGKYDSNALMKALEAYFPGVKFRRSEGGFNFYGCAFNEENYLRCGGGKRDPNHYTRLDLGSVNPENPIVLDRNAYGGILIIGKNAKGRNYQVRIYGAESISFAKDGDVIVDNNKERYSGSLRLSKRKDGKWDVTGVGWVNGNKVDTRGKFPTSGVCGSYDTGDQSVAQFCYDTDGDGWWDMMDEDGDGVADKSCLKCNNQKTQNKRQGGGKPQIVSSSGTIVEPKKPEPDPVPQPDPTPQPNPPQPDPKPDETNDEGEGDNEGDGTDDSTTDDSSDAGDSSGDNEGNDPNDPRPLPDPQPDEPNPTTNPQTPPNPDDMTGCQGCARVGGEEGGSSIDLGANENDIVNWRQDDTSFYAQVNAPDTVLLNAGDEALDIELSEGTTLAVTVPEPAIFQAIGDGEGSAFHLDQTDELFGTRSGSITKGSLRIFLRETNTHVTLNNPSLTPHLFELSPNWFPYKQVIPQEAHFAGDKLLIGVYRPDYHFRVVESDLDATYPLIAQNYGDLPFGAAEKSIFTHNTGEMILNNGDVVLAAKGLESFYGSDDGIGTSPITGAVIQEAIEEEQLAVESQFREVYHGYDEANHARFSIDENEKIDFVLENTEPQEDIVSIFNTGTHKIVETTHARYLKSSITPHAPNLLKTYRTDLSSYTITNNNDYLEQNDHRQIVFATESQAQRDYEADLFFENSLYKVPEHFFGTPE